MLLRPLLCPALTLITVSLNARVDVNSDEISDIWAMHHWGVIAVELLDDPDGDGRTNFEEFTAGTLPLDSASFFSAELTPSPEDNRVLLRWRRVQGKLYGVETSSDLMTWTPATGTIVHAGEFAEFDVGLGGGSAALAASAQEPASSSATLLSESSASLSSSAQGPTQEPQLHTCATFGEYPLVVIEPASDGEVLLSATTLSGRTITARSLLDWSGAPVELRFRVGPRERLVGLLCFVDAPVETVSTAARTGSTSWSLISDGLSEGELADARSLFGDLHEAWPTYAFRQLRPSSARTESGLLSGDESLSDAPAALSAEDGEPPPTFWRVQVQDQDSDGDGLDDAEEALLGTNPAMQDSDGDGLSDHREVTETLTDPNAGDTDGDGLGDGSEDAAGTNPNDTDTDSDGDSDKTENDNGTNPNDPQDNEKTAPLTAYVEISDQDLKDDIWAVDMSQSSTGTATGPWTFIATNFRDNNQTDAERVGWGELPIERGQIIAFRLRWVNAWYPDHDEYRIEFKWKAPQLSELVEAPDNSPLSASLPRGGSGGWDPPDTSNVKWVFYYPKLTLRAWGPGTRTSPGREAVELKREKTTLAILNPNTDNDDARPEGARDLDDQTLGAQDDDLVTVELDILPRRMPKGHAKIELPAGVRAYTENGELLEPTDLDVDLKNPSGKLAAIADGPVKILLEATAPQSGAKLKLLCNQSEASLQLVSANIVEVISDQISGNECNGLPTAYFRGEPNNPMLMATRSGVEAHLAVRIDVPPEKESLVYVGVRKIGTQTILGSAQSKALPEKVLLQFNAIAGCETYEVVAGGDSNKNNRLDDSEAIIVFERTPKKDASGAQATAHLDLLDKVIIVTETQFGSSKADTINNNVWGTDYAGDLISAFGHGTTSVPEATVTNGIDIDADTPGLSHPVGARWDASCHDATYRFAFADGTEASDDFEGSTALAQIIDEIIQETLGTLIAQANTTSTVCPPITFNKSKNLLETEDSLIGFNELGLAFGKVTIIGSMTVTARRTGANSILVESVTFSGSFDDLYDFAYGSGGKAREAAIVQAGHATLAKAPESNSGKVFFTLLQFNGSRNQNETYSTP